MHRPAVAAFLVRERVCELVQAGSPPANAYMWTECRVDKLRWRPGHAVRDSVNEYVYAINSISFFGLWTQMLFSMTKQSGVPIQCPVPGTQLRVCNHFYMKCPNKIVLVYSHMHHKIDAFPSIEQQPTTSERLDTLRR
jgi:hypothetical protein